MLKFLNKCIIQLAKVVHCYYWLSENHSLHLSSSSGYHKITWNKYLVITKYHGINNMEI